MKSKMLITTLLLALSLLALPCAAEDETEEQIMQLFEQVQQ